MNKISLSKLLAFSALVMVPFAANASNQQRFPGVIDKDIPELDVPESHSLDKKQADPLEKKPEFERTGSTKVVATLKKVTFKGNTIISDEILNRIAADYLNRPLTEDDLAEFKYKVRKLFYDRGYILVKPVTPPQNLADGVMEMTIYEAKIGSVTIHNEGALNPTIADSFAKRIHEDEIFHERGVESMVRDLNDLKNIAATVNVQPGKKLSTSDLHIAIEETFEDVQNVTIDSYGSELTGRAVGTLHLEKSNLLKLGETFEVDLRKSSGDLGSIDANATIPTGIYNTKFELGYLHSENEIGDRLAALNARGETDTLTLALSGNVFNTRNTKATVRAGLENRRHKSYRFDLLETRDDIRQGFTDLAYLWRSGNTVVYNSNRISKGLGILDASNQGDPLNTRAAGDPEAWIIEPLLVVQFRPLQDGTFRLISTAQLASETLLSSDLFVLGGYGSVRGFEPAEATGESGYQFSVQYDHSIDIDAEWQVKAGPFLDGGAVNNKLPGQTLDNHLYSAGLGLEFTTQFMPDIEPTSFRFDWAHPLGNYNSPQVDDNMVYFRVSQNF